MTLAPDVSILVSTYNRSTALGNALRSLVAQQTDGSFRFEVVVIDNASTDETPALIRKFLADYPDLVRTATEHRRGVAHARNRAVAEARGTWLAFFDDDQLADPRWLAELMSTARRHNCQCVGGAVRLLLPPDSHRDLGPFCRDLLCETVGRDHEQPYDRRFKPGTGNLMIHRDLFEQYGPFDVRFNDRGEDTMLFLAILKGGHATWYTPRAIVHHVIPAHRMHDDSFMSITRRLAREVPHFEKHHYGPFFPVAWSARLARAVAICLPSYLMARCSRNHDRILDRRCRLLMEWNRVVYGAKFLVPRRNSVSLAMSLRPTAHEELVG